MFARYTIIVKLYKLKFKIFEKKNVFPLITLMCSILEQSEYDLVLSRSNAYRITKEMVKRVNTPATTPMEIHAGRDNPAPTRISVNNSINHLINQSILRSYINHTLVIENRSKIKLLLVFHQETNTNLTDQQIVTYNSLVLVFDYIFLPIFLLTFYCMYHTGVCQLVYLSVSKNRA